MQLQGRRDLKIHWTVQKEPEKYKQMKHIDSLLTISENTKTTEVTAYKFVTMLYK